MKEKIIKILLTVLEPYFLSIIDIFRTTWNMEINFIRNVMKEEEKILNVIKNISIVVNDKAVIEDASKMYYWILLFIDGFLILSILEGKIIYIPMSELFCYIIIFIISIYCVLNLLLKYSKFNNKLKLFSIIQVLIIIPIVIVYWIVSIEGVAFELKELDVNQWSSIFNNIIIYFATCVIGILSVYKNFFNPNENIIINKEEIV